MALRDQPYLPLYVNDFVADEKLRMCSAESTGVYIRLMCLMHVSEDYGAITLSKRDKRHESQVRNFASVLLFHFPYSVDVIERSLDELIDRGVLSIDGDRLIQKRMQKDGKLSIARGLAGSQGGKQKANAKQNIKQNASKTPSKTQANSEIEIDNINAFKNEDGNNAEFDGNAETPDARAELSQVMALYMDKINLTPSPMSVDQLKGYTEDLGADVVCRAIEIAVDENARKWSYIQAILQNWTRENVRSLDDVARLQAQRAASRNRIRARAVPEDPLDTLRQIHDQLLEVGQ
jgi:DnaD/phage-associated family protein